MRLYNDYNSYLKERYGCKVYRIALDAGFSCPNRDGTKGRGGCIYCNEDGSRSSYTEPGLSVSEQIGRRIEALKQKGAKKFIAYFQAFTNTHASSASLKKVYDEAAGILDIVGLSIGTRPDSIDRGKLELIDSYKDRYDLWIEYGLQSVHDKTLKSINRGHDFQDFVNAVEMTRDFNILVSAHVILGLPGETKDDMLKTARVLSDLRIDGIKIHLLHILKGSGLEKLYAEGKVRVMEQDEYVELVCDFLENLSGDMVIQRLTAQGPIDKHVAPMWALDKIDTINRIGETLRRRGTYQGIRLKAAQGHQDTMSPSHK
ncbi:MAG: TIGR01212 family radical SAM protein [Candidatus Omnitrophica bacterium]|nr:TIGR01212 family radical SAM protein [Candidatus Omnitrophota bacterium]